MDFSSLLETQHTFHRVYLPAVTHCMRLSWAYMYHMHMAYHDSVRMKRKQTPFLKAFV